MLDDEQDVVKDHHYAKNQFYHVYLDVKAEDSFKAHLSE